MSGKKILAKIIVVLIIVAGLAWYNWSSMINLMMPTDSRPHSIEFPVEQASAEQMALIVADLMANYAAYELVHIERFQQTGIDAYEGPATCLGCHEEIHFTDCDNGLARTEDLMENLTGSAHYLFFTTEHPNVYGFNGELADNFPMGKINRPCPKPGSLAMTAWAEIVITNHGDTMSEGCGQCHIGGQYQAPLGEMMPAYSTTDEEKNAIDCLICHAVAYDMNKKQVVVDDNGFKRWDQDRSLKAALSVTTPTSQACLRCHQHNLGGDIYVDEADSSFMQSMVNTGRDRPRVLHPGSKRGTPFSPTWDVHARAGVQCIECHVTEGHRIAKGMHTTTMMANDLPHYDVACENCHTPSAHGHNQALADYLNEHTDRVACQTCHITSLQEDNATRRDFNSTVYQQHEGIYVYNDTEKETLPGKGITYRWWNGDGTFLGNAIGDNPNGADLYRFYTANEVWPEFEDYDYAAWYEEVMRPIAKRRPSKLYAMKQFQGRQHIDLGNIGPFGGMYVPYNLPTYYLTGDPDKAAAAEMEKSMMQMMYGFMFKYYLLDKFISFMDIDQWNTGSYEDVRAMRNVEARWIPNDATMEISHSIRRDGALTCERCHSPNGVLNWAQLGYTADEIESLSINPLE